MERPSAAIHKIKPFELIDNGTVKKGHVVVIRYEGPQGGPGMPEMLAPTSKIVGRGLGKDVALITDGQSFLRSYSWDCYWSRSQKQQKVEISP